MSKFTDARAIVVTKTTMARTTGMGRGERVGGGRGLNARAWEKDCDCCRWKRYSGIRRWSMSERNAAESSLVRDGSGLSGMFEVLRRRIACAAEVRIVSRMSEKMAASK